MIIIRLNTVKISIISKLMYAYNIILIKIPNDPLKILTHLFENVYWNAKT